MDLAGAETLGTMTLVKVGAETFEVTVLAAMQRCLSRQSSKRSPQKPKEIPSGLAGGAGPTSKTPQEQTRHRQQPHYVLLASVTSDNTSFSPPAKAGSGYR